MDVFNKFCSVVSSVLLGNFLFKDFDVFNYVVFGGFGLFWKIYNVIKRIIK